MKKVSIFVGLLFLISASAAFSQTIEFFYGEIKAVNVGYYRFSGNPATDICCAVQVGTNEIMSPASLPWDVGSSWGLPILVVKETNLQSKELLTLLLSAQLNGQKVHLRTYNRNVNLRSSSDHYYNEILEASVGEKWVAW